MKEFVIESNIPIPESSIRKHYPLDKMKIGDSFFVETNEVSKIRGSILNVIYLKRKENKLPKNWKFITKKENNGLRVWRIK